MLLVVSSVPLDVLLTEGLERLLVEPRRIHCNRGAVLVSELQCAVGIHRPAYPTQQDLDFSGEGKLAGLVRAEMVYYGQGLLPVLRVDLTNDTHRSSVDW
jgi:hypothetical protein